MRVIDLLEGGMRLDPDRTCVIDAAVRLSHREVLELSHRVACGLKAAGLDRGSRVGILGTNTASTIVAMVGVLRAGMVWLPVHPRNVLAENLAFMDENRCEFLFLHGAFEAQLPEIRAALPSMRGVVGLDRSFGGAEGFSEWSSRQAARFDDDDHGPEDLAWIKGTGGTTGKPKSVMICQRNVEALFSTFHLCMPLPEPHVNLVAAPLSHGAGNIALCVLFRGGTLILHEKAEPARVLEAIERHRVTTMFLPPTVIFGLLADPSLGRHDCRSLRYFISAGAPMPPAKLAEAIDAFGPVMCQAWGQSEAPFVLTWMAPHELADPDPKVRANRMGSCGRASPLTRVEVMDAEGRLLGPYERGELVVRGNLVMKGYFARPAENEAVSRFGWHHTGDVGYRDDDGFVHIVDRAKDMVISGGFNIFPSEIEQVLCSHPDVLDCAVIGVPDDKWGEALKAIVELKPGRVEAPGELARLCRERLGGMKTPKTIEFWSTLPRSGLGKVLKREIRERYWQGQERRV